VATGTVVVTSTIAWAILSHRRGAFIYLRVGLAIIASIAFWFLAVDYSLFVTDCSGCRRRQYDDQYRVFGVAISTEVTDEPTVIQLALRGLGVPCEHDNSKTWHKHRYCGYPCINALGLAHEPYTDEFASKLRKLGVDNPELAARLHDRAVRERDLEDFWRTLKDVTGTVDIRKP
jgi:hypothetical protein